MQRQRFQWPNETSNSVSAKKTMSGKRWHVLILRVKPSESALKPLRKNKPYSVLDGLPPLANESFTESQKVWVGSFGYTGFSENLSLLFCQKMQRSRAMEGCVNQCNGYMNI